jgi:hypothetical protein
MHMHTIKFRDGHSMGWDAYRRLMKGEISPFRAVALSRPKMALDAAPRWQARDQALPAKWDQAGGGSLSRTFIDATNKFLADQGLSEEDCQMIGAILEKYAAVAADEETLEMAMPKKIPVGPRGQIGGASDRRLALDEYDTHGTRRCVLARAMPLGLDDRGFAGFAARFPDAIRIKTV